MGQKNRFSKFFDQSVFECSDPSVLILTSKQKFINILDLNLKQKGWNGPSVYREQEDFVWLIPSIESFSDESEFKDYLEHIKPKLLAIALRSAGLESSDLLPCGEMRLDDYFDVEIRLQASSILDIRF